MFFICKNTNHLFNSINILWICDAIEFLSALIMRKTELSMFVQIYSLSEFVKKGKHCFIKFHKHFHKALRQPDIFNE